MKKIFSACAILCACVPVYSQQHDSVKLQSGYLDSVYIASVEKRNGPAKVLHAEPLYIDLIRDLGARKGEKEWNLGIGMTDNLGFDAINALIEYEFAPIDRLGLEIELPFTFYTPQKGVSHDSVPSNILESLKLAAQWTFLVSEKKQTSLALGYIHEFMLPSFREMRGPGINGHVFNPFFVAARRWGSNWHTLIYTGPHLEKAHGEKLHSQFDFNSNIHYMLSGSRHFIGVEFNKSWSDKDFDMTIRPQMRLHISHNVMIGIVGGIPVRRENQRMSMFTRLIWEPGG